MKIMKKNDNFFSPAGFPSGQYMLETRLHEIRLLAQQNVNEIDIVIQRPLALTGQWLTLYDEVKQMKEACGKKVHMKTILGVGELASCENIYRASIVAMLGGSDFIKTSTGKEKVNATIPAGKRNSISWGLEPASMNTINGLVTQNIVQRIFLIADFTWQCRKHHLS